MHNYSRAELPGAHPAAEAAEALDRIVARATRAGDDELAAYRFPDGTLDIDALELGIPAGPPPRARRLDVELEQAVPIPTAEVERRAREALEASRERRQRRHEDTVASRYAVAVFLVALGIVVGGIVLVIASWPY